MWWKCESQIHHKILAKHILRHCDKNVMIMWLGKKIYESHLHHDFITILKVMKMWRKCDELTLVLIFWLLSFENSRHGKKVDDHQRWRKEMTVCSGLLALNRRSYLFVIFDDHQVFRPIREDHKYNNNKVAGYLNLIRLFNYYL